jgi:hypothetical protein
VRCFQYIRCGHEENSQTSSSSLCWILHDSSFSSEIHSLILAELLELLRIQQKALINNAGYVLFILSKKDEKYKFLPLKLFPFFQQDDNFLDSEIISDFIIFFCVMLHLT